MKTTILKIAVCLLLAAPVLSRAQQDTNMAAPAAVAPPEMPATNAPAKPKKPRTTLTVTGKVVNVDTNVMALTIGKHTYDVTSATRITKAEKPAVLSDIAVDDKVTVVYKKAGDKLIAATVSDGKKSK